MYNSFRLLVAGLCLAGLSANAQLYHSATGALIKPGAEVYDTLQVAGLQEANLNSEFGLCSVELNIDHRQTAHLVVSLISPDGTIVHLAEQAGTNAGLDNPNFSGTTLSMDAELFLNELGAPFSGSFIPDNSLGRVNNGQNGNGAWKLRVLNKGMHEGRVLSWTMQFNDRPAEMLLDSTNLPIVVISTGDVTIPFLHWQPDGDDKVQGNFKIIAGAAGSMNHLQDAAGFSGNILIGSRGYTSRKFPQRPYSLDMKGANWQDTDVALLDMPAEEDWLLIGLWCDKSLLRDALSYQLSREMGRYAPRTRFCELVLNGDYKGIYLLTEKIKRGKDRVDIPKTDDDDTDGSYIVQIDRMKHEEEGFYLEKSFCKDTRVFAEYEYPKPDAISDEQAAFISSYIDSMVGRVIVPGSPCYREYVDVPSFIDFMLMQELAGNLDAYSLSSYMHKAPGGKLVAGPIWDMNLGYGNTTTGSAAEPDRFRWAQGCAEETDGHPVPVWWPIMYKDSDYEKALKQRYTWLRAGILSKVQLERAIDQLAAEVAEAQVRHFRRWPILDRAVSFPQIVRGSWDGEVAALKDWLAARLEYLDELWNIAADIQVYPNPTEARASISAVGVIKELTLRDMAGRALMSSGNNSATVTIDLSHLRAGIYILTASTSDGGRYSKKIVKL